MNEKSKKQTIKKGSHITESKEKVIESVTSVINDNVIDNVSIMLELVPQIDEMLANVKKQRELESRAFSLAKLYFRQIKIDNPSQPEFELVREFIKNKLQEEV